MNTYCIFCRNGSEQKIVKFINEHNNQVKAIAPTRIISEKTGKKWSNITKPLIPGYVFLYCEEETDLFKSPKLKDIYKVLEYDSGIRNLAGADLDYAMWIYNNHGQIAPSLVFEDGDKVVVTSGALADFKGRIVKIEKRKRRALVEFEFEGVKRQVSLSVEYMAKKEDKTQNDGL